jgi:pimeloyl-ACP methyl ester carboxylesterase
LTVDHQLIASVGTFTDPELGIRERFLTPTFGGATTVAILSEPIATSPRGGWVWCGSFGAEQGYLTPFEVSLTRRLAATGHAVLRYHDQGYGDSELDAEAISLGSHRQDALDAVGFLRATTPDLATIGLIGPRFGGTVAALVAAEAQASALVLIDPVVSGSTYVRTMLARSVIGGLKEGSAARTAPAAGSNGSTVIEVEGTLLDRAAVDEIAGLDLARAVSGYRGPSFILQVSRSSEPREPMERLRAKLADLGGDPELRVIADPDALRFGLPRFRRAGGSRKVDVQTDLSETLVSQVVRWAGAIVGAAP